MNLEEKNVNVLGDSLYIIHSCAISCSRFQRNINDCSRFQANNLFSKRINIHCVNVVGIDEIKYH